MGLMVLHAMTMDNAVVKPILEVQDVMSGLIMQVNNKFVHTYY